jgi:DNA polymerase/3'-5' exonuclease PolX
MTKSEIAAVLEEVAALLELKGENPFKIRAYTNAARSLETFGGNISNLQDEEALSKIPGIGKSIADKIRELAVTGSFLDHQKLLTASTPGAGLFSSSWSLTFRRPAVRASICFCCCATVARKSFFNCVMVASCS